MNARDAILSRIRTQLAKAPEVARPEVPEVWPHTGAGKEKLIEQFTAELAAVGGECIRCATVEEARDKLVELAKEAEWESIGSFDHPDCREVAAGLADENVVWATESWDPKQKADLSLGLVPADYLMADTGACMVACASAEQRLLCYLPPACVVVARAEQLREHMPHVWSEVAHRAADPELRGEFVFITGPSRTADIEKILIIGVHGPKRLVVLLIG